MSTHGGHCGMTSAPTDYLPGKATTTPSICRSAVRCVALIPALHTIAKAIAISSTGINTNNSHGVRIASPPIRATE